MADPIWLDANLVASIADGNTALEAEVKSRSAGRKLLMPPQAHHEYLYGNPLTAKPNKPMADQQPWDSRRVKLQQTLTRLNIEVDLEGKKVSQPDRVGMAMQDQVPRPKNLAVPPTLSAISESDSLVLSQVKAGAKARGISEPVLLTTEKETKPVVTQASKYGVKSISLLSVKGTPGGSGGSRGGRPPTPNFGGKIGPGLKSLGVDIGVSAAGIGLSLLAAYLRGLIAKAEIERQVQQMVPRIQKDAANRIEDVIAIQVDGRSPWANITVSIMMIKGTIVSTSPDSVEIEKEHGPFVSLEQVTISDAKKEGPGTTVSERTSTFVTRETTPYTFSVTVGVSSEELELYRWFKKEIQWFDQQLQGKLAPEDFVRISNDRDKLMRDFRQALAQSAAAAA